MKKVFNKTFLIIILILMNLIIIIYCFISLNHLGEVEKIPQYSEIPVYSYDEYLTKKKKKILVEQKDINKYISYQGILYAKEINNLYNYYYVDSLSDQSVLSKLVDVDYCFGTKNSVNIVSEIKGKIVDIQKEESLWKITVFKASEYYMDIFVSEQDFYKYDYTNTNQISIDINNSKSFEVKFDGVNYADGFQNGYIKIRYSIDDNEYVLVPNTTATLKLITAIYENKLVINSTFFEKNPLTSETLFVYIKKDNSYINYEVFVDQTIGEYYIISDTTLKKGDYIYVIE